MFLKDLKRSGSILVVSMLVLLVISSISVTVYNLSKSNQRQNSAAINSGGVHNRAFNAAQFAINNLQLTPQQTQTPPPSCNTTVSCKAAPQASGIIAFAWTKDTVATLFGSAPNLVNNGAPLSFWQTYAYPVPGTTTDFVLVQINSSSTSTSVLYNIVGYSNVNGNVATYATTYSWAASPCSCISIASLPAALPTGNLAASYGHWWANNSVATQKAGGQIAYNGGLLYMGLPETNNVYKAWIDPNNNGCCDTYCRWNYSIPVVGRYVQIYLKDSDEYLHLGEVQVFDQNNTNIALGKVVTGSSSYGGGTVPYSNLVNGNLTDWTHNDYEANAWLQIDLGSEQTISKIVAYNRPDCCQSRINGVHLAVVSNNNSEVYHYNFAGSSMSYTINPPTTNVQVSNVTGRYVWLYYDSVATNPINVSEIEVYNASGTNIASSATVYDSIASPNANYVKDGSFAQSVNINGVNPWIMLDFGANVTISRVVVYNTGNLNRARIGIADGTTNSFVYQSALFFGGTQAIYTVIPQTSPMVSSVSAQHIRVQHLLASTNKELGLAEIRVYNGGSLLSSGATVTGSSTNAGYTSSVNTGCCTGCCATCTCWTQCQDPICKSCSWWTNRGSQKCTSGSSLHTEMVKHVMTAAWQAWCVANISCNAIYTEWDGNGATDDWGQAWSGCNSWTAHIKGGYSVNLQSYNRNVPDCGACGSDLGPAYNCAPSYSCSCAPCTCACTCTPVITNLCTLSNATNGNLSDMSCTGNDSYPWINVNLGSMQTITNINLTAISAAWPLQNTQVTLYDSAMKIVYRSAPLRVTGDAVVNVSVPSTTIPTAYTCASMYGDGATKQTLNGGPITTVPANGVYQRCVGYGLYTGANTNGQLTVPTTYNPS